MDRLRGLPAVLAMLLGGAAVALVAGAGLYALRRRRSPEAEWAEGVAALAEHEATEEAARELDPLDATSTPAAAASAPRAGPASSKPASPKPARGGPGRRGSTVIRGFQVLLAALVGVLIGFGVYLATGGTIVR